jgi:hypothetical protein
MIGPKTRAFLEASRDNAHDAAEAVVELLEGDDLRAKGLQALTLRHELEDHLRNAEAAEHRLSLWKDPA